MEVPGVATEEHVKHALRSQLIPSLPLRRITSFLLFKDDLHGTGMEFYESLTRRMGALEEITSHGLRPKEIKNLARLLSRTFDGPYFPATALRKLHFQRCTFDEDSATTLLGVLGERADAGIRLTEMELENTVFGWDRVRRFQRVADIVRWDARFPTSPRIVSRCGNCNGSVINP